MGICQDKGAGPKEPQVARHVQLENQEEEWQ